MSKFNPNAPTSQTTNLAGGVAYKQSNEMALVSLLLTSFAEDKYYSAADEQFKRLASLIASCDKHFAAQAILFARNTFGMRSITHVATSLLAYYISGEPWAARFFDKVVHRVDDMTEIVAYHKSRDQKISNAMKRGFSAAFGRFDAYQISKYRGDNKSVKLVDIVNICHPKETAKTNGAIGKLVRGELKQDATWEALVSAAGGDRAAMIAAWNTLLDTHRLGYFALIRNIRNIISLADKKLRIKALFALTDEHAIKHSLVLPFRFDTAYKELLGVDRDAACAISRACEISCSNVPKFDGKTLVAVDVSGSMSGRPIQIASLFAAILAKSNNADIMTFHEEARYAYYNPDDTIMTIKSKFDTTYGGTDFNSVFVKANERYDRIILLSDMQSWGTNYWSGNARNGIKYYRNEFNPDCKFFSFDLAGYGSLLIPEKNTYCLAGFSDKVFDIMARLEMDQNALVETVKKVEI